MSKDIEVKCLLAQVLSVNTRFESFDTAVYCLTSMSLPIPPEGDANLESRPTRGKAPCTCLATRLTLSPKLKAQGPFVRHAATQAGSLRC